MNKKTIDKWDRRLRRAIYAGILWLLIWKFDIVMNTAKLGLDFALTLSCVLVIAILADSFEEKD